jgi:hypothetical protein
MGRQASRLRAQALKAQSHFFILLRYQPVHSVSTAPRDVSCYMDESGTSSIPGNTSHFVLVGVSIPIWHWRDADRDITNVLARYDLAEDEFHTAWLLRKYLEQSQIPNFAGLDRAARRSAIQRRRTAELLRLQRSPDAGPYRQTKKTYKHTEPYIHLTFAERLTAAQDVADAVARWGFARLFAECIDKVHFDPKRAGRTVDEQAFEQVVTRFDRYLTNIQEPGASQNFGLLVHDNNESVAKRHTELMRRFHQQGTLFGQINRIIETPLFVDSKLTRMVQIADLCAYALRRFVENREMNLFKRIFARADRVGSRTVGVRHFTGLGCGCPICDAHMA